VVVDHPPGASVYPDERFATDGVPSQDLIAFEKRVFPVRATDHRGRDLTATLREWDRRTADGFGCRAWAGLAEEHYVELDFGDALAKVEPGQRVFLCLAGWTEYPALASTWAAHQAGVALLPPVLERRGEGGRWQKVGEAGFP